jgi:hypothetical protein
MLPAQRLSALPSLGTNRKMAILPVREVKAIRGLD